jgi:hypothetical protein
MPPADTTRPPSDDPQHDDIPVDPCGCDWENIPDTLWLFNIAVVNHHF